MEEVAFRNINKIKIIKGNWTKCDVIQNQVLYVLIFKGKYTDYREKTH